MITVLLLLACGHDPPPVAPTVSHAQRFDWAAVERPDLVPVATLAAQAIPAPGSEVHLAPPAAGRILRWHVQPGMTVEANTPLADLASPQMSSVRAQVSALSSRVQEARRGKELLDAGVQRGVTSRVELQAAVGALREAESELAGARAQLDAYGGTGGSARTWNTPVAGIVGEIRCPVGPVQEGVPCLTLQRDQEVLLQVRVPARHLRGLQGPLQAEFHSLDGTRATFIETSRAPSLDPATRSLLVQFSTDEPVLPGSAGKALLSAPRQADLVLIPRSAITRVDGTPSVFTGSSENPRAKSITVVGGDADHALVGGLHADDQVATRGVFLLKSTLAQEEP